MNSDALLAAVLILGAIDGVSWWWAALVVFFVWSLVEEARLVSRMPAPWRRYL